ncbi:hypothetical protein JCM10450v2_003240 [Rhodotorula kratochvilovae]
MPTSSTAQHDSPLARIPDELLLAVLEHIDQPQASLSADERHERRATLSAICLASTRLRDVAQPVLWRHVELHSRDDEPDSDGLQGHEAMKTATAAGQAVRKLELHGHWDTLNLAWLAALCPNVDEICIEYGVTDWREFARFTNLRRFSAKTFVITSSTPPSFPRLESLSLSKVSIEHDAAFRPFCTHDSLPSLRHLAADTVSENTAARVWSGPPGPFFPALTPDFVDQLDDLQLDVKEYLAMDKARPGLLRSPTFPPTVCHSALAVNAITPLISHTPSIQHLQFAEVPPDSTETAETLLFTLRVVVHNLPSLRLILLPSTFWPPPNPDSDLFRSRVINNLEDDADARGFVIKTYDPQTGAFARMPNELFVAILEYIDRPLASLTDEERAERRRTLYAAYIASRSLFRVAQPILWRCVRLQLARWGGHHPAVGLALKGMRRAASAGRATRVNWRALDFGALAAFLPNIEKLVVDSVTQVEFRGIAQFTKLRRLVLRKCNTSLSSPTSFPHLQLVGFEEVGLKWTTVGRALFTTEALPAVRRLSLRACTYRGRELPTLPAAFVAQLEGLQLNAHEPIHPDFSQLPPTIDSPFPHILFHSHITLPHIPQLAARTLLRYIQVTPPEPTSANPLVRIMRCLRYIWHLMSGFKPPPLRLLLLPSECWPPDTRRDAQAEALFGALVQILRARGVEIRAYYPARPLDGLVVPEFREFLRERAEREGV